MTGAAQPADNVHPFRKHFEELRIGETLTTHRRTVTEADIVNFRGHQRRPLLCARGRHRREGVDLRQARGARLLRAQRGGGLFVDPAPGPVLANYGLENLRFTKPVYAGDTIQAKLTCKSKTAKETPPDGIPQGVVAWDVNVTNQENELVATYTILTLVKRLTGDGGRGTGLSA